jgi:hypothetical protein
MLLTRHVFQYEAVDPGRIMVMLLTRHVFQYEAGGPGRVMVI